MPETPSVDVAGGNFPDDLSDLENTNSGLILDLSTGRIEHFFHFCPVPVSLKLYYYLFDFVMTLNGPPQADICQGLSKSESIMGAILALSQYFQRM